MKTWMKMLVGLLMIWGMMVSASMAAGAQAVVVGRIYYIEGDLLRYVPAEKDWVAVVRDAPFGVGDTLFSGNRGRAELYVPNGTWVRPGNSTQLQFIALESDLTEVDVARGYARFYNKSARTVIKAQSPFGYVLAYPGSAFDFYVGDNSVEVVAVKGKVSFVHSATDTRYEVAAGSPSILADQQRVSSGSGTIDIDWDRWNQDRERLWAAKSGPQYPSSRYLPEGLQQDAYVLDEAGRWEMVWYEGRERWFWRPDTVAVGWSPFTVGRWVDWSGDQTWIPAEPFGYVTHHYGNWVYIGNYWYWAPPVVRVRVGLPLLDVGFFWYPGRVSWIYTDSYVGWVPLAPFETYYCARYWGGPHMVVVTNINITTININVRNYAYVDRAVVVPQDRFYGGNNYQNVRVTNINHTTVINNYQAAPVVNNTVINNYTTIKKRYEYTNIMVNEKPHQTTVGRIQYNQRIIQEGRKENATMLQRRVAGIREGMVRPGAGIDPPKVANILVPAGQETLPQKELRSQPKEIKNFRGETPNVPTQAPVRPARPSFVIIPEHVAPARPGQPNQVVIPEHVAPARPERPSHAIIPEYRAPARMGQPHQVVVPEHAAPVRPNRPEHPDFIYVPEHTAPARPGQPHQVTIPEHVAPRPVPRPQPAHPGPAVTRPEKGPQNPEGPKVPRVEQDRSERPPHREEKER